MIVIIFSCKITLSLDSSLSVVFHPFSNSLHISLSLLCKIWILWRNVLIFLSSFVFFSLTGNSMSALILFMIIILGSFGSLKFSRGKKSLLSKFINGTWRYRSLISSFSIFPLSFFLNYFYENFVKEKKKQGFYFLLQIWGFTKERLQYHFWEAPANTHTFFLKFLFCAWYNIKLPFKTKEKRNEVQNEPSQFHLCWCCNCIYYFRSYFNLNML